MSNPTATSPAMLASKASSSAAGTTVDPRLYGPGRTVAPVEVTGSQSIIRSLEELGVTDVFGIPGGAILPTYDPLMDSDQVNHILVRHEQGAGHAAEGYAMVTGEVGRLHRDLRPRRHQPGHPIADAHMDSMPMVAITGQVNANVIGTDAFQEADIVGITMPDHQALLPGHRRRADPRGDGRGVPPGLHRAARPGARGRHQGRPGRETMLLLAAADRAHGYRPVTRGHSKQIREAAKLIAAASAAGALHRRRDDQGQRGRGAHGAGRDCRRPRGHHADGPRRVPGLPRAEPGDARDARHGPAVPRCSRPTC